MFRLPVSVAAWGSPEFSRSFKGEVEQLPPDELPLQCGLALSSHVSDEPFKVVVLDATEEQKRLRVKASIFYSGVIAGCSCADDPTPLDVQPEYCEVEFDIDKASAETSVAILPTE